MIAKFKYSYQNNGQEIIENVCGKVNAFKIKDTMVNYEATFSTAYMCVGGAEYSLDKVSDLTFYTKTNDIHTFMYKEKQYHIDGQIYNFNEMLDRLSQIYINENIIKTDDTEA